MSIKNAELPTVCLPEIISVRGDLNFAVEEATSGPYIYHEESMLFRSLYGLYLLSGAEWKFAALALYPGQRRTQVFDGALLEAQQRLDIIHSSEAVYALAEGFLTAYPNGEVKMTTVFLQRHTRIG
jgi:hypothetical protein